VPALKRIWFDDPRGLRNYDEPGLAALDFLLERRPAHDVAHPGFFEAEVARASRRTWRRCSSPAAPRATPRAWCTRTSRCWTAPRQGQAFDKLTGRRGAGLHAPAWIGQNIFSYAQWLACGYVVNCPRARPR
jgi:long-chain acyl-CoA synthetase